MSTQNCYQIAFPLRFDGQGRTAETTITRHIEDLIEQVLFTSAGERVNRPTFGSGLLQTVFEPNSDPLAAARQFLVNGSLQQWLGDLIQIQSVEVENDDSILRVSVQYLIRRTLKQQIAQFTRSF